MKMQAWLQNWMSFRRGRCPSEQTIAAYADQRLIASERYVIERHLSNCDRCLQQVGFLARTDAAWHDVPAALLQTALNRTSRQNTPGGRFLTPWIPAFAAALFVFAIFLSWSFLGERPLSNLPDPQVIARQTPVPTANQKPPHAPQNLVRGPQENTASPLLSPLPKQRIAAANLEFRWQSQPQVTFYELRLASDSGEVVWEGRADAAVTSIRPPARIHLQVLRTYYAWLRVHLVSGAVQQFAPVEFVLE
jgi:hypothetical protein